MSQEWCQYNNSGTFSDRVHSVEAGVVAGIHLVVFARFPSEYGEGCHGDASSSVPSLYVFFRIIHPLHGTSQGQFAPERYVRPRTAQTKYRKFEKNIPRKRTARLQSQFLHSWAIYIFLWSIFLFYCRKIGGLNVGIYTIDRSQTHECDNADWGRAIPFLGIYKFKFLCSAPMNRRWTAAWRMMRHYDGSSVPAMTLCSVSAAPWPHCAPFRLSRRE